MGQKNKNPGSPQYSRSSFRGAPDRKLEYKSVYWRRNMRNTETSICLFSLRGSEKSHCIHHNPSSGPRPVRSHNSWLGYLSSVLRNDLSFCDLPCHTCRLYLTGHTAKDPRTYRPWSRIGLICFFRSLLYRLQPHLALASTAGDRWSASVANPTDRDQECEP